MPLNFIYNSQLEKYKLDIASLFANTILARYSEGAISKYIIVPILFSKNSQWYDIANSKVIRNQNVLNTIESNIPVPCMSLSINPIITDEGNRNAWGMVTDDTRVGSALDVSIELTTYTKRSTDAEMIFEQIHPRFNKAIPVTVNLTDEIEQEIIVNLADVDLGIPEDWELTDVGLIESLYTFTSKVYIYKLPYAGDINPTYDVEFEIVAKRDYLTETIIES